MQTLADALRNLPISFEDAHCGGVKTGGRIARLDVNATVALCARAADVIEANTPVAHGVDPSGPEGSKLNLISKPSTTSDNAGGGE